MEYTLVPLRDKPSMLQQAAAWFHQKWSVPLEAYLDSMEDCLNGKEPVP